MLQLMEMRTITFTDTHPGITGLPLVLRALLILYSTRHCDCMKSPTGCFVQDPDSLMPIFNTT